VKAGRRLVIVIDALEEVDKTRKRTSSPMTTPLLLLLHRRAVVLLLLLVLLGSCDSLAPQNGHQRRAFIGKSAAALGSSTAAALGVPSEATAAAAPPAAFPLGGIGGGVDVTSPARSALTEDVIFPASVTGLWQVERKVVNVQGDAGQAENVWRLLGGKRGDDGAFRKQTSETYQTRFILPPEQIANKYFFEGEAMTGVVLDRGFDLAARSGGEVSWDAKKPGMLTYGGNIALTVVQRSSEPPGAQGFGSSNELIRIDSGGGIGQVQRAARVQRRFRRNFEAPSSSSSSSEAGASSDTGGSRVIEGIELVKTYRVLDGVAGVEFPTSTTKSVLRLVRPSDPLSQQPSSS
jgi:hypothetical protein